MSHIQENLLSFYSKLNKLREEEEFIDMILKCESRSFKCHRLVLIAASPYFATMFNSSFKESTKNSIVLKGVSATTFEAVLLFMYTGDVDVNTTNVCDLLRMSDYFSLPGIEDLCLKFVTNNKHQLTIQNLLHLFLYSCAVSKNKFVKILCRLIAQNFSVCCKLEEFLKIPFDQLKIIVHNCSSLSSSNEESVLSAIIRWTCHKREERLQHLHEFLSVIKFQIISPGYYTKILTEVLTPERDPIEIFSKPVGCDTVAELQKDSVLETTKGLHVLVRYGAENSIRIFSVNRVNECTNSGVISPINSHMNVRCVVSDDLYLYSLNYLYEDFVGHYRKNQTFSAYTSIDRRVTLKLTPPPILFGHVNLCYMQNNIYAYCEESTCSSPVRTDSISGKMFDDEQIERGIFAYNCSSDNWFPVPRMKKHLQYSCMTASGDTLYLIGGTESYTKLPCKSYMQAFDFRAGWRMLPASCNKFMGASCSSLNGKIYVCGGVNNLKNVERYDPVASKWETIQSMNSDAAFHRMIQFNNKLWVMGSRILDEDSGIFPSSNDLSMDVYDAATDIWSKSSILTEAAAALTAKPGPILDSVVFSIL